MKKIILGVISVIIIVIIALVGYRYFMYQDFIGKFYSEDGGYYEFGLFNWKLNSDGDNKNECDLWNCDNEEGIIYYVKENQLHLRMDSKSVVTTPYKLEKKGDKVYLYFYDVNGDLAATYLKTL